MPATQGFGACSAVHLYYINIWLNGLESVCVALGLTAPGQPVYIAHTDLTSIVRFRAVCYGSMLSRERTVARSTLEKETHRCADTQRKYERIEGVLVKHNYVAAAWTQEDLPIPDGAETWECVEDGVPSVLWQVPNTYKHGTLDKARPGMTNEAMPQTDEM